MTTGPAEFSGGAFTFSTGDFSHDDLHSDLPFGDPLGGANDPGEDPLNAARGAIAKAKGGAS